MLLTLSFLGLAAAKPPSWVTAPAFTADPDILLHAAAALDGEQDVVVLLDDWSYDFDATGKRTRTHRIIWQLHDNSARDDWSVTEASWAPWREERPEISARIILPKQKTIRLDPSTFSVGPDTQNDNQFNDRKVLHAPLPGIRAGALVEEQTTWTDTSPYLSGGDSTFLFLRSSFNQVAHVIRRVDVHRDLPFQAEVVGGDDTIKKSKHGDRRRATVYRENPPRGEVESYRPADVPGAAFLRVTTSKSWSAIGAAYWKLMRDSLDPSGLDAHLSRLRKRKSKAEQIDEAYRMARDELRYTGIEFGENSIKPHPPKLSLERGYGDCKDKAAFLISLLTELGVPAKIALLTSGMGLDVDPDHPTARHFDHAIVYLPEQDRWLDPTDSVRPASELPTGDYDRWALVVGAERSELKRTPPRLSSQSTATHGRLYTLTTLGHGDLVRSATELTGWLADEARGDLWQSVSDSEQQETFASWAESRGGTLKDFHLSPVREVDTPFEYKATVSGVQRAAIIGAEAATQVYLDAAFLSLPEDLVGDEDTLSERENDYVFYPYNKVVTTTILTPPDFSLSDGPEDLSFRHGSVEYTQTLSETPSGVVFHRSINCGNGRLTADEARALRTDIQRVLASTDLIQWTHQAETFFLNRQYREAFDLIRARQQNNPTDANLWYLEATLLGRLGLRDQALAAARVATTLAPNSSYAFSLLGNLAFSNDVAELGEYPFLRDEAISAYERSASLEDDLDVLQNLAVVYELGHEGVILGRGSLPEKAVDTIKRRLEAGGEDEVNNDLMWNLIHLKRYKEAREFASDHDVAPHFIVALTAIEDGVEAAVRAARGGDAVQQTNRIQSALLVLSPPPHTKIAGELSLTIADRLANSDRNTAIAERQIDGYVDWRDLPKTPENTILSLYGNFYSDDQTVRSIITDTFDLSLSKYRNNRRRIAASQLPLDTIVFNLSAALKRTTEGNPRIGWRVAADTGQIQSHVYVVEQDGEFKIRATNEYRGEVAEEVLTRATHGDLRGAKQWLAWLADEASKPSHNPFGSPPTSILYTPPQSRTDVVRMTAVFTDLLSLQQIDPTLYPVLLDTCWGWFQEEQDPEKKRKIAEIVARNELVIGDLDRTEEALAYLQPTAPQPFFDYTTYSLLQKKEAFAELLKQTSDPADTSFLTILNHTKALVGLGQIDEAIAWVKAKSPQLSKKLSGAILNELAWELLKDPERYLTAQEFARLAVQRSPTTIALLHSLALANILVGDLDEAVAIQKQAIKLVGDSGALPPIWHNIEGHMLHTLGYTKAAKEIFDRMEPVINPELGVPISTIIPEEYR